MLSSLVTGNWARLPFMGLRVHGRKKKILQGFQTPWVVDVFLGPVFQNSYELRWLVTSRLRKRRNHPLYISLLVAMIYYVKPSFLTWHQKGPQRKFLWSISDHPSSYPCPTGLAVLVVLLVALSTPTGWQTNVCHPPPPTGAGPPEDKDLDINLYMNHLLLL